MSLHNRSSTNLFKTSRLYVITPDEADTQILLAKTEPILQAGIALLQYRNKLVTQALRATQAHALLSLCKQYQTPFVINDHLDLCLQLGADGVHLGGTDGDIAQARAQLGPDKIIGASCYNQADLARSAQAAGASYVAFGACFTTSTKPNAVKADLSLFQTELNVPKVAIGGITLQNAPQVFLAGADAIAVITDIYKTSNVTNYLKSINSL